MMIVKYVINVVNEGVHKSKNFVLYKVLKQGSWDMCSALNKAFNQKHLEAKIVPCSNEQKPSSRSVVVSKSCSNELFYDSNEHPVRCMPRIGFSTLEILKVDYCVITFSFKCVLLINVISSINKELICLSNTSTKYPKPEPKAKYLLYCNFPI